MILSKIFNIRSSIWATRTLTLFYKYVTIPRLENSLIGISRSIYKLPAYRLTGFKLSPRAPIMRATRHYLLIA